MATVSNSAQEECAQCGEAWVGPCWACARDIEVDDLQCEGAVRPMCVARNIFLISLASAPNHNALRIRPRSTLRRKTHVG